MSIRLKPDTTGMIVVSFSRTWVVSAFRRMAVAGFVVVATAIVSAQHGTTGGEWRTWGGDLGATRYAPLDQINGANFNTLQIAWRFKTDNLGTRPDFNLQATPLFVNGVLYATAGEHRNAVALDAGTGELLWMHRLEEGQRSARSSRRLSGRGVGYWTDGKGDERVFYVTIGYQLVGLNAKTGKPLRDFGGRGQRSHRDADPRTATTPTTPAERRRPDDRLNGVRHAAGAVTSRPRPGSTAAAALAERRSSAQGSRTANRTENPRENDEVATRRVRRDRHGRVPLRWRRTPA